MAVWNSKYAGKKALSTVDLKGYKFGSILKRLHRSHQVIWAMCYNEWPDQIDHINGYRADNRLVNLRSVNQKENNMNMKRPKDNTSGFLGVCWCPRGKKWRATIVVDKHQKHLGMFDDFNEAVRARKFAESKYKFHSNHGRD